MQLALNTYFVTLGVRELGLSHLEAGAALACAQAGGLAGRLGWGFLAMRIDAARSVLVCLGLGMTICASMFGLYGDVLGKAGQYDIHILLGNLDKCFLQLHQQFNDQINFAAQP